MTEKRFHIKCDEWNAWSVWEKDNDVVVFDLWKSDAQLVCEALNELYEEKEYLKKRFHEERELAMRLSRECDTLTIKKQELELEIIRLETIIRTGDNDDCNRTS